MYELYYLLNQSGPIDGDKLYVISYATEQECHNHAATDAVAHYSVEFETSTESTIIFSC